jgi:hypothetical protein
VTSDNKPFLYAEDGEQEWSEVISVSIDKEIHMGV